LAFRENQKKAVSDCISRCSTVEKALHVDLHNEYLQDGGDSIIKKLSYSKDDFRNNVPAPAEFSFKAIPHNSAATLTVPTPLSASCKNLDIPPVNLRFLQSHLTKIHSSLYYIICAVLP